MTATSNSSSKKRIKGILFILFVFVIWAGLTIYHQWSDIQGLKAKYNELKKEEEKLQVKKNELEKEVYLLNNYDYIAEMARKYYFLSKPGEVIIISPEE